MKAVEFLKKNIILTLAWVLAIVSMFFVVPSAEYSSYIDWRTLGILWSLMLITRGLMEQGVFRIFAHKLVEITSGERQLGFSLVMLCFFLSMIITNDVCLITFVPFTIYIFYEKEDKRNLIYILVLETVAANLGSMLTPIGNPQNLYLYNLSGMSIGEFIRLMLPYSAASFFIIGALCIFIKKESIKNEGITISARSHLKVKSWPVTILYLMLLAVAGLVILRMIEWYILVIATLVAFALLNRKAILKIDYGLLFTFIGFFIFVGNMGNIHMVEGVINGLVDGHEMAAGILASQVISNVPAALLLSGFTSKISVLIKAVNIGGLGTLIASMASLITFKLYANETYAKKGRYFLVFTLVNIGMLAALIAFDLVII